MTKDATVYFKGSSWINFAKFCKLESRYWWRSDIADIDRSFRIILRRKS